MFPQAVLSVETFRAQVGSHGLLVLRGYVTVSWFKLWGNFPSESLCSTRVVRQDVGAVVHGTDQEQVGG